ncbi:hypothetical protein JOQ06_008591, partial [Pogonophryne albipinna]
MKDMADERLRAGSDRQRDERLSLCARNRQDSEAGKYLVSQRSVLRSCSVTWLVRDADLQREAGRVGGRLMADIFTSARPLLSLTYSSYEAILQGQVMEEVEDHKVLMGDGGRKLTNHKHRETYTLLSHGLHSNKTPNTLPALQNTAGPQRNAETIDCFLHRGTMCSP